MWHTNNIKKSYLFLAKQSIEPIDHMVYTFSIKHETLLLSYILTQIYQLD